MTWTFPSCISTVPCGVCAACAWPQSAGANRYTLPLPPFREWTTFPFLGPIVAEPSELERLLGEVKKDIAEWVRLRDARKTKRDRVRRRRNERARMKARSE